MAGYEGWSKSNNALDAEDEGRYPMSRAKVIVSRETGVTQKEAAAVLTSLETGEYHHTSKFFNSTNYYDTDVAIKIIHYTFHTGAPVEVVLEMVFDNDIEILTERVLNHAEERRADARNRRKMRIYRAEVTRATREEKMKKATRAAIQATCPHTNARVIRRMLPSGMLEPAYRKCPECHANYLTLSIPVNRSPRPKSRTQQGGER